MENSSAAVTALNDFLSGGGQMGAAMRSFDFTTTALGPVTEWPASLRAATSICINSRYPMFIAWGKHRSMLYNDAYTAVLANKHPWSLGRPAQQVWAEIWHIIGPHWARVIDHGDATWAEDLLLVMNRSSYDEETYFTFSYSPIRGEGGSVDGMFCACQETTEKVIGERRLKTLRELAAQATIAKSPQEAIDMAMKTFSANPADIPFSLIYLVEEGNRTFLAGSSGLDKCDCSNPNLSLDCANKGGWPLESVIQNASIELSDTVNLDPAPAGCWEKPATRAILLPLKFSAHEKPSGVLVCGISPVRELDESYRTFFEVAAGQTATAIANARAYQQERQRAEALAEIDRAKTIFFSNVSHEFRTPLTLMLGPVEDLLATSHTGLSPAAKGQLEIVNRNGLRLLRLVNTLLDFSRIEAGRVQAVFEQTDLASFTEELASVFRAATERAGLKLLVDCPKMPEPVYVDRDMWEKVLLNLVSNAFKFTLEGEIEVTLREVDGKAELRVRDTGVGIAAEEMPRIFERFHRIQNVRSRTHEGSGIGLALVQELIKLHSGAVRVESRLNQGTTFIVTVPLGKDHLPAERIGEARSLSSSTATGAAPFVEEALRWLPEPSAGEPPVEPFIKHELLPIPSAQEPDEKRPWVLVADDNADMRQYLWRILSERYNVKPVPDGQAALSAARERRPDLILSDVMMPGLDGFGLAREIRADEKLKTVPVILLSARAGEESRVEGLQHGADDYLIKPFSARELLARVTAHLDMARLRKEAEEALRESDKKYRELFESMSEAFCIIELIFDENGKTIDYRHLETNPAYEKHVLRPMLGKRIKEVVPDIEQYWLDLFGRVALTGEPAELENVVEGLGNQWFHTATYRVGGEGSRRVAVVFENITERKLAEEALRESAAQLRCFNETLERQVAQRTAEAEERARQLQQLAIELSNAEDNERKRIAMILHDDLQQHLGSLRFNLFTLLPEELITGNTKEQLLQFEDLISQAIKKTRSLSHELSPPVLHQSGLLAALNWLVKDVKEKYGQQVILNSIPEAEPDSTAMASILFRSVRELLFNAQKHSGTMTALIEADTEGDFIRIRVKDHGKGCDVKTSKARVCDAPGFGLFTIEERIHFLGGQFEIDSIPGNGCCVTLRVPKNPESAIQTVQVTAHTIPQKVKQKQPHSTDQLRIMLVDDHASMRQGMSMLLKSNQDFELVAEASNGVEAVKMAQEFIPDIILMDVSMPKMDGIEATAIIKKDQPFIRIIGLSMHEDERTEQRMVAAGASAYISKVAPVNKIIEVIRDHRT